MPPSTPVRPERDAPARTKHPSLARRANTVSVVIPSHNRPDLLAACLESVGRYAPPDTQVIVVDDGSAGAAASAVARSHPGAEVVRLPRPRGFCVAANAGIAASRGEVVELLNDDTEVGPGWAEAALACFRNPRVGAVAPLVLQTAHRVIDSAGDRYDLGGVAGKRGHGERPGPTHAARRPVFGASASSAFYRREALRKVGGFPECFGAYFEDVDLSFRLHRAGYEVVFEPGSRVRHHGSASYRRPRRRLLEQQSRNEERVFWRNVPAHLLGRAIPLHILVLLAKTWKRWDQGGLIPFLSGRLRVLGEIADLARHRRWLQELGDGTDAEHWQLETCFLFRRGETGSALTSPAPGGRRAPGWRTG